MAVSLRDIMAMVPQAPQVQRPEDITSSWRANMSAKAQADHLKALEEQAKLTHAEAVRAARAGEEQKARALAQEADKFSFQKKKFAQEQFKNLMSSAQDPQMAQAALAGMRLAGMQATPGVHTAMPQPGAPLPVPPSALPQSQDPVGTMMAPGTMGGITPEGEAQIKKMQQPFDYEPLGKAPPVSEVGQEIMDVAPGLGLAPLMMDDPEQQPAPEEQPLEALMQGAVGPEPPVKGFGELITNLATKGEEKLGITVDDEALQVAEMQKGKEGWYTLFYEGELLGQINTTGWTPETKAALGLAVEGLEEGDAQKVAQGSIDAGAKREDVMKYAEGVVDRKARMKRAKAVGRGKGPSKKEERWQKEHKKDLLLGRKDFDDQYKKLMAESAEVSLQGLQSAQDYLKSGGTNLVKAVQYFIARAREPNNPRMTDLDIKMTQGELSWFEEVQRKFSVKGSYTPQELQAVKERLGKEVAKLLKSHKAYMGEIARKLEKRARVQFSEQQYIGYTKAMDAMLNEKIWGTRKYKSLRKKPDFPFSSPATTQPGYEKPTEGIEAELDELLGD